ncbi:pyridoxamine 5'-phosphate oxidase family protein [Microbacterium sp. HD4P20]|uniref:MSMEG_1061 family FMN-dependent PPOX-type flavoprotein n=1 Tax=Microbacterium sp. HD4P20 TaxID=2864874 RepID=UPI001C6410C3|nr:MSMEG_1061 family FMN-dependent PPOX-type flavoprotein [Microbacterium sp. HD4P20]MCP2635416.1 pyridoxamine 5'-phosphate oxidase family protein [Microbacterium sp. HD4P20]
MTDRTSLLAVDDMRALDLAQIRSALGEATPAAYAKITDHLDENCLRFLAHSPFCCLSTSDASGACDCSPRGDYPGFVRPLDSRTIAIPDRLGNKLADSMQNIVSNGHVGLLCFVPGMSETLRINGSAFITDDPGLLSMLEQDHSIPDLAIVVRTEQVYLHCGRALLRAGLWDPEMQDLAAEVPHAGQIWASTSGLDEQVGELIDQNVRLGYRELY